MPDILIWHSQINAKDRTEIFVSQSEAFPPAMYVVISLSCAGDWLINYHTPQQALEIAEALKAAAESIIGNSIVGDGRNKKEAS